MKERIEWVKNTMPKTDTAPPMDLMTEEAVKKAWNFHRSFPCYAVTPLINLSHLAQRLGIRALYLKDESYRFNLNAFKVLGGSYAMAQCIAQKLGQDVSTLPYAVLISEAIKKKLGDITFYTATDGNHGRGVAWAANTLRQKSVVFMPAGSSQTRLQNILKEGAEAQVTDLNYDEAVCFAHEEAAQDPQGIMVQDTAWEGYEEIPGWIMQGYGTMSYEVHQQLARNGVSPTHIFVQAGVGSLAGSVQGYVAHRYKEQPPVVTVVEAAAADCLYRSAKENNLVLVGGSLQTIMAGLACGKANTVSWPILKRYSGCFVSVPDWVAAKGMRMLGAPLPGDRQVISGESGAVTTGLLAAMLEDDEYRDLRESLGLHEDSVVLVFSTEGDTDPERYRSILWEGAWSSV
ncbi:MAG: diaminopropionate ammonia-lyase [Treponema sp.]|jgi:diaminopropionate ammonia-lyase|nr:diaminopropionate ammonia-lyase [Treponema sp.]